MSELRIRRNRTFAAPRYQSTAKTEKTAAAPAGQKTAGTAGCTVSETLQRLMSRVSQAENHSRESRRTLQTGQAVLAEVRDSLERLGALARESAGEGSPDRAALQAELEQLRGEIGRMLDSALSGDMPLFLDGDPEILTYTLTDRTSAGQEALRALPEWLLSGIAQDTADARQLLADLGLDQGSTGADILAALTGRPLEAGAAAGRLAALYLGAVIAATPSAGADDPNDPTQGLQLLLEKVSQGFSPDRAVELLTDGTFTSMADFQAQFTAGTAPGMEEFLVNLLLTDGASPILPGSPLLSLLAGLEGSSLESMMELLTASQAGGSGEAYHSAETPQAAEALRTAEAPQAAESPQAAGTSFSFGGVEVIGQDLSQVSFDNAAGLLTVAGAADVVLRGTDQAGQATVLITGSGQVTLEHVRLSGLTVDSAAARVLIVGASETDLVLLREGARLTLDGEGLLKIVRLEARPSSVLHLTGGAAAAVEDEAYSPVVLADGPVSLAARTISVTSPGGKPMAPFDIVWKTLLPGWSAITSMSVDGRQAKTALLNGAPLRLWLDTSHGFPAHTLVFQGRDASGRPLTRYAYLHWNRQAEVFQEISMFPNPFSVTGGEAGLDWIYEEESCTLRILSSQVTAVSGGSGTDANQLPFSGRIALSDGIGSMSLTLDGVTCRVSDGCAFSLGRENDVTLVLRRGTSNLFESGPGCAGISLGDGTCLSIDCVDPEGGGKPDGLLTASGGEGSAGIGWDSAESRRGHILIRGGAGIGAGRHGFAGTVTIVGGMVTSSGEGGEKSLSLQMGEDAVTLPQFSLSVRSLQLDGMSVSTREAARAALKTIEADRLWVSRIQAAYGALYNQLERSFSALYSVHRYVDPSEGLVRDTAAAGDLRQSILHQSAQAVQSHSKRWTEDVRQLLE